MLHKKKADVDARPSLDPFEVMELEFALDLQDPSEKDFETCVASAASVVGGDVLFVVPADPSMDDASRVAAIRLAAVSGHIIVFAVLDAAGRSMRMASKADVGERLHGFAKAFVGVLERLRDDRMLALRRPEGSA